MYVELARNSYLLKFVKITLLELALFKKNIKIIFSILKDFSESFQWINYFVCQQNIFKFLCC